MGYPQAGVGFLSIVPDVTNPTPARIAFLSELSFDISKETKELYGEEEDAQDVFAGKRKITGKFKFASWEAAQFAAIVGGTVATGRHRGVKDEAGTIPSTPGPYTITVTNGANSYKNVGVIATATGLPMERVAGGAEATGKYSVVESTGVYTFAAADQGLGVKISYWWTDSSTGKKVTLTTGMMGDDTVFSLEWYHTYKAKEQGIRLPKIMLGKMSFGFKQDDHASLDVDFTAYKDGTLGGPAEVCFAE
jgi:hypothetical protein